MKASEIDRIAGETGTTLGMGELMERTEGGKPASWTDIPTHPGIYVVYLPDGLTPSFSANAGRARCAKPTETRVLREKWRRVTVNGPTDILYIGKGGGLRPASAGIATDTLRHGTFPEPQGRRVVVANGANRRRADPDALLPEGSRGKARKRIAPPVQERTRRLAARESGGWRWRLIRSRRPATLKTDSAPRCPHSDARPWAFARIGSTRRPAKSTGYS